LLAEIWRKVTDVAWHDSQQLDVYLPLLMKRLQQQRGAQQTALPLRVPRARWHWVIGAASAGTLLLGGWIAHSIHALSW